jgi:hypothetical protein
MNEIPKSAETLLLELNKKYPKTVNRIRNIWGKTLIISDNGFIDIMTLEYGENKKNKDFLCINGWRIINRIHEIHSEIYGSIDRNEATWHLPV